TREAARGRQRGIAVARRDVEDVLAGTDVNRLREELPDNLQRRADDGEVAARPGGLLTLLDCLEVDIAGCSRRFSGDLRSQSAEFGLHMDPLHQKWDRTSRQRAIAWLRSRDSVGIGRSTLSGAIVARGCGLTLSQVSGKLDRASSFPCMIGPLTRVLLIHPLTIVRPDEPRYALRLVAQRAPARCGVLLREFSRPVVCGSAGRERDCRCRAARLRARHGVPHD